MVHERPERVHLQSVSKFATPKDDATRLSTAHIVYLVDFLDGKVTHGNGNVEQRIGVSLKIRGPNQVFLKLFCGRFLYFAYQRDLERLRNVCVGSPTPNCPFTKVATVTRCWVHKKGAACNYIF